jgi:hypothetical protein
VANSNTEICNLALIELGLERISSLANDQSEAAKICRDKWAEVRDAALRGGDWRCLIKRAQLAREAAAPAFGYLYQYALPVDYYRMLSFSVEGATWEIEGRLLLTDLESASIRYVGYDTAVDPVALFDPLLTTYLATMLAAKIAPSTKSASRKDDLLQEARDAFSEAIRTGAVETSRTIASCTSLTTGVR